MEMLDVYDENGKYIGVRSREFCHSENPGVYHKPVWVWVVNGKGEILLQKRAKHLKENANKWDAGVAGHTKAGETFIEACIREAKEEIGIETTEKDFIFIREWLKKEGWEFAQIYLLILNIPTSEMTLQENEVSKIKWVKFNKFVKLLYSNKFAKFTKEYQDWVVEMLGEQIKNIK